MNSYEFLKYLTIKLTCQNPYTKDEYTATGFYAMIKNTPVFVTARHFAEEAEFSVAITAHYKEHDSVISLPVSAMPEWTLSNEYDIAYTEVKPFAEKFKEITGKEMFYTAISEKDIITKDELYKVGILNEVLTIGYPGGISSTHHEFPLFKKGHISSLPKDFAEDETSYLDLCADGGFSGAPLFLNNSQLKLVGVLVAAVRNTDEKHKSTTSYVTADKLIELSKKN